MTMTRRTAHWRGRFFPIALAMLAMVQLGFLGEAQGARLEVELDEVTGSTFPGDAGEADLLTPAEDDDVGAVEGDELVDVAAMEAESFVATETLSDEVSLRARPGSMEWNGRFESTLLAVERSAEFAVRAASEADAAQTIGPLPVIYDAKVERHMRFFHTAIRDRFEKWLERLHHYRPTVEKILSEFNLPPDIIYLSLVESGFNPHAYSRARATGPWQFMKGTARLYGLRVDRYVDERRDPIKSTVAAARYLRDLYDLFGTWPLAMAAYNAGEGKVRRALRKTQSDSFWEIARTRYLRRETREYVPRFMAATIIAKNPQQYGFSASAPDVHQFEEVVVKRAVRLRDIAHTTGVSYVELRRLNPELRRNVTPPKTSEYHLKVPVGSADTVAQALERIPAWNPSLERRTAKSKRWAKSRGKSRDHSGWYRVRVGDSLWKIARRFGLTVRELRDLNDIKGRLIRPGDLLAISP